MHELTQSGEYVKCLYMAAAVHFYHDGDIDLSPP